MPHKPSADLGFDATQLAMPGWHFLGQEPIAAYWQDAVGDAISLNSSSLPMPLLSDSFGLQQYCRRICESQRSGLVEVTVRAGAQGPCLTYLYKRLEKPAFKFYGVVMSRAPKGSWIWMVHTGERGVTGVREATVTAWLAEAGELTIDSYESSWARDPYEPEYAGVDGSTLRYLSDAVEYDAEFPNHPLTKTRRELARIMAIQLPPPPAA